MSDTIDGRIQAPVRGNPNRISWDRYFMEIAQVVAKRATCDRKHVGCVIADPDNHIIATGYNGSIRGAAHCDDVGHQMEDGHCVRTVHSEANAISQAAQQGVSLKRATLYVTASPCWGCFKLIANSGIRKIVYGELYRDESIKESALAAGIDLLHLPLS